MFAGTVEVEAGFPPAFLGGATLDTKTQIVYIRWCTDLLQYFIGGLTC